MIQKGLINTEDQCLKEIKLHLKKAIRTLRNQPYQKGDKPKGISSSWIYIGGIDDASGMPRHEKNTLKPTPKQISHMQYWVDQMLELNEESRRIVMARAAGIPWRRLEEIDGRSHTTLRKIEKNALYALLPKLLQGQSILPRDHMA